MTNANASDSPVGRGRTHQLRWMYDLDGRGVVEPPERGDHHSGVHHALGLADTGLQSIGRILQPSGWRVRRRRRALDRQDRSPVNHVLAPGHRRRAIGGQERDQLGDLRRLARPTERDPTE